MPDLSAPPSGKETTRLEAFSDGIFGVAITLLAIEIGVAHGTAATNAGLWHGILAAWPKYLAYFASFVQILFMWMAHHAIFGLVRRSNVQLMLANGLLLLLVVLVPFPNRTLGEYIATDAQVAATVFYTGYFVVIGLAFVLLMYVACHPSFDLLRPDVSAAQVLQLKKAQWLGFTFNLIIAAVAGVLPWLALALSTAMWVYWALLSREQ